MELVLELSYVVIDFLIAPFGLLLCGQELVLHGSKSFQFLGHNLRQCQKRLSENSDLQHNESQDLI